MEKRTTDLPQRPSRRPPALVIRLAIEQPAQVMIEADSFEDEQRLRLWLERSGAARRLFGQAA
jgi:hypothetical protein